MWLVIAGWIAAALVFSTFFMKTMVRLRLVAIAGSVAFMTYGLLGLAYGDLGRLYRSSSCTRACCRSTWCVSSSCGGWSRPSVTQAASGWFAR
jgi:hypothetical protein